MNLVELDYQSCEVSIFYWFWFFFAKQSRVHLLDMEPFQDAFGRKTKRKRPKLVASDYEALVKKAAESQGKLSFLSLLYTK